MGTMSNDPSKLAFFAGFYKSIQSTWLAEIWRGDTLKISYMNMFIPKWVLLVGGLVFTLPMSILHINNHTETTRHVSSPILSTSMISLSSPILSTSMISRDLGSCAQADDKGHIRPTEAVAAEIKAIQASS
ncbi:hypothetical protein EDD18DRAFT_32564 [Armillaria luteobubalina]|uniref:Uncharacterized protein n=1 Tax=Armillaria luteobubalina TaxID=153913 RepID=A0AA39QRB9_9AGAR|nr:hypothetical protein EDD18DRAFT_32564 [Armillaria luteobubalina]